ncbi:beta-1,4-galactosyltransferase 4-like [Biomphalaria glabrata]|uniref:Beta-1,4-galactosyltransferase n=1 Tax=Biomphalaria glabrata TaxID=6526 RepID=A0A9W2Z052_BIOGL|nr:beta-1,4-galactosyltransferase 4-like [Biomphalaria glabrata]
MTTKTMKINKYLKMTAKVVLTISIVTLTFNLLFSRNSSSTYFHRRVISEYSAPSKRSVHVDLGNSGNNGSYGNSGNTEKKDDTPLVTSSLTMNTTTMEYTLETCLEKPKHLIGLRLGNYSHVTKSELVDEYIEMEPGGHLRPQNCKPGQTVAIIIPYRNRSSHLHILLHNLIPFLTRQNVDVTFFVIEQAGNSTFNRGALFNVGFLEVEKFHRFDCYILHDVDIIPLNDHNLYRCSENPRHFAVAINKHNYKLHYESYFGGVVGLIREQYLQINGHSNLYIGWGTEDDDLLIRVRNKNLTMVRYDPLTARYDMIQHDRDVGNAENPMRLTLRKSAARRQDVEGLNTVTKHYQVLDMKLETLYTWITVSLNNSGLLETAPAYTMRDISETKALLQKKSKQ